MCAEVIGSRGPALPSETLLLERRAITGYDANVPPGLSPEIVGGEDEPTHNLSVNNPTFGQLAPVRSVKGLGEGGGQGLPRRNG